MTAVSAEAHMIMPESLSTFVTQQFLHKTQIKVFQKKKKTESLVIVASLHRKLDQSSEILLGLG